MNISVLGGHSLHWYRHFCFFLALTNCPRKIQQFTLGVGCTVNSIFAVVWKENRVHAM